MCLGFILVSRVLVKKNKLFSFDVLRVIDGNSSRESSFPWNKVIIEEILALVMI